MNRTIRILNKGLLAFTLLLFCNPIFAQQEEQVITASDSAVIVEADRNVMLNAANSTGPREVNIGLPASVGGTTILENGLPVVYFFWPELPIKAWRNDATISSVRLLDLGQTAINVGDVGFSVSTFDNLGTDVFQGRGSLNSNHFGLLRGDINLSGPIGRYGTKFTAGAYVSFDPGTFRPSEITRYYADRAQLYKAGLTQDYTTGWGTGAVTLFYKYANVAGLTQLYSPYIYGEGGKISELDNFRIGRDSYMERSGKAMMLDVFTEQYVERDIIDDYKTTSHTLDLIWNHTLNQGLKINGIVRYHASKSGHYLPIMTGVNGATAGEYMYTDGTPYTGDYVQNVMLLNSRRTPIKTLSATFDVGKTTGNHEWRVGLNQWYYDVDKFATESAFYVQEVAPNPRILIPAQQGLRKYFGGIMQPRVEHGGMTGQNSTMEYHDGSENKTALFATDRWNITDVLTLDLGARFEYQNLRGYYQDRDLGITNLNGPKTRIKKDWLNMAFMASAIYKITSGFGVLGEVTYNEQAGHLENYNIGTDPNIKKSRIPGAVIGLYYNHPIVSVVSKATYIQRDEYRATVNFTHPETNLVARVPVQYDIQTFGWTTDVVATPFRNFNLHFLLTFQSPKYRNYTGTAQFDDGSAVDFNYNGKIVNGISKVLIEIDPSYTWRGLRVWASGRYFSKTYANLPNTLNFEGRWETFAGASYTLNEYLDFNVTVVNLLNQRGAQGTISGTELVDEETAQQAVGTVLSGTYIRPFTVEFGMRYRF